MAPKDAAADVLGSSTAAIDTNTKPDLDEFSIKSLLAYDTPKKVRVKVWQLGLAFTIFQVGLFAYVVYSVMSAAQWSSETPVTNTINAWVSNGDSQAVSAATMPYCGGNVSYDYDYGSGWTYFNPTCRSHASSEVSVKSPGQVFITTMYQETVIDGWACDASDAAARQAACSGTFKSEGQQCTCTTLSTLFPIGTEKMTVSFRHAFTVHGHSPTLRGDSNLAAEASDGTKPLDTFVGPTQYASGSSITMTVAELLSLVNISLDADNVVEPTDARPGIDRKPKYRTTGALITMDIEYSNRNPQSGRPDISLTAVRAEVAPAVEKGWAGLGALPTIFAVYPNGYTFSKIVRYRQGVVVNFVGRGSYYFFDTITMVMALVTGAVLLSSATLVTDLIATNLYRLKKVDGKWTIQLTATSQVLRNKRVEHIAPEQVMASHSMRAVFAVASFHALDVDADGVIDAHDIVSAFAKVGGVTHTEACEMAKLIMHTGDRSGGERDGKLSFPEFVSVISQDLMPFSMLLTHMDERARLGQSEHMALDLRHPDGELNAAKYDDIHTKMGYKAHLPADDLDPAVTPEAC